MLFFTPPSPFSPLLLSTYLFIICCLLPCKPYPILWSLPSSSFVRWLTEKASQHFKTLLVVVSNTLTLNTRRDMEKNNNNNKKKVGGGGYSSSTPPTNFDHLFGPMDPSTTSSNSTSIFGSIFPPPSTVCITFSFFCFSVMHGFCSNLVHVFHFHYFFLQILMNDILHY